MATYDIRFVLRHAKDFIRQSGWIYTTTLTENDKASITAVPDFPYSRMSSTTKLIKDLKILLVYTQFDFTLTTNPGGSILIDIVKRSTPIKIPRQSNPCGPRQADITFKTLKHTRRKNNAPDADQSRNRTSR
jgi:hypothetical protein